MEEYKDELADEKEKKDVITKEETEIDHLSLFMFGTNSRSIRKKEKREHSQLIDEEPSIRRGVKGDDWILGRGNGKPNQVEENEENEESANFDAIANFLNQIDLELLMKNVDMFMTSANDLKPIFKKITPFIKKWMD
ncbi:hypothetical protein AB3U99_06555 [Niallia sp. JL1B1071]|uniref:hypothetical protein n=1 Tax=Niallia tiangongensis TaxID=3237105 RepID=UPI0037DCD4DC